MPILELQTYEHACDLSIRHAHASGIGLSLPDPWQIHIEPEEINTVNTGVHIIEICPGYQVNLAIPLKLAQLGITVLNPVIETTYRGEIFVILGNLSLRFHKINPKLVFCYMRIEKCIYPSKEENLAITNHKGKKVNLSIPRS